jgi:hypothetical protein
VKLLPQSVGLFGCLFPDGTSQHAGHAIHATSGYWFTLSNYLVKILKARSHTRGVATSKRHQALLQD